MSALFGILKRSLARLLAKKGDVFYINGPETLPPPLTHEEESDIVGRLESDVSLRSVLVERNLRLVVYIAKRFENTSIGIEDLISIGTIGLIKAINTFKADKNIKLATYASRCIENEILMYIRKTGSRRCEMSIDEPLSSDWDGNELLLSDILGTEDDEVQRRLENEEERTVLHKAVERLPPRDRTIIELRFGLNTSEHSGRAREMTQKEVADLLGISQSYISRLEKRIIAELKKDIAAYYR